MHQWRKKKTHTFCMNGMFILYLNRLKGFPVAFNIFKRFSWATMELNEVRRCSLCRGYSPSSSWPQIKIYLCVSQWCISFALSLPLYFLSFSSALLIKAKSPSECKMSDVVRSVPPAYYKQWYKKDVFLNLLLAPSSGVTGDAFCFDDVLFWSPLC